MMLKRTKGRFLPVKEEFLWSSLAGNLLYGVAAKVNLCRARYDFLERDEKKYFILIQYIIGFRVSY